MNRRTFIAACAGGLTALSMTGVKAMAQNSGPFANTPLKMAISPGWMDGDITQQLEAIAKWGFGQFEDLGPGGDLDAYKATMDRLNLKITCIVGAGSIAPGHMVQPADHDKVVAQFKDRVAMAKKLGCKNLVGLTGNRRDDVSDEAQTGFVVDCLKKLAPIAEENDVLIVMESLNTLVDHGGYFLTYTGQTMDILKKVGSPNVKMLFDIYHQQIMEGNVIRNLTENIADIGHIHVGDNPGRQYPGTGELNYKNIFKAIAETKYDGYVVLECGKNDQSVDVALNATLDCLKW